MLLVSILIPDIEFSFWNNFFFTDMSHFICLREAEKRALARGRLYLGGVEFISKRRLLICVFSAAVITFGLSWHY